MRKPAQRHGVVPHLPLAAKHLDSLLVLLGFSHGPIDNLAPVS